MCLFKCYGASLKSQETKYFVNSVDPTTDRNSNLCNNHIKLSIIERQENSRKVKCSRKLSIFD